MPKPTWENLADDKRERITEAAMAEFGDKLHEAANIDSAMPPARMLTSYDRMGDLAVGTYD